MYLTPAVRTARDDPTPGVESTLLVRLEDGTDGDDGGGTDTEGGADSDGADTRAAVREAVDAVGGEVAGETRFDSLRVTVAEPAVADLLDGLPADVEAVETATPGTTGDAGEDLDPVG